MALQTKPVLSPEDYLVIERAAEYKSEYLNGEMFAMAGASEEHNLIVLNTGAELRQQLKKRPCRVYPSDMRVKVSRTGLYTYPDLVVVCDQPQFEDHHGDTLINPLLIIEVLSNSTENYDRGKKFEHYRQIESLAEYVLIAQDRYHIETYRRQASNTWSLMEMNDPHGSVHLEAIACELALVEVYDKVEWKW
jgi:Uma2 family endonuclease